MASRAQEGVKLDALSVPQLSSVKKQLDEEVEHLSASYTQLGAVQAKFKECARIVDTTATSLNDRNDILVPLTNSLYVRGKLSSPDRVIVDVGTGFYVEKNVKAASKFYEEKIQEIDANIRNVETIVQNKTESLRSVEEVLRQKVLAAGAPPS